MPLNGLLAFNNAIHPKLVEPPTTPMMVVEMMVLISPSGLPSSAGGRDLALRICMLLARRPLNLNAGPCRGELTAGAPYYLVMKL